MLKLLGAILIVGTCSLMGVSINRRLCDRVRVLQEWVMILQEIKSEIVFRAAPIPAIFQAIADKQENFTSQYFKMIYNNMRTFGLQSSVELSLCELRKLPLTESDLRELQHVFDSLGRYDAPTQAESLARTISALEHQLLDAKLEHNQKGRLYQAIGVSCGIALALVAI